MSNNGNPLSTVVELHTENRANFDVLDFAGSTGLLPDEMILAKNFIEDVLLVSPKLYQFRPSDGSIGNFAIGFEANVDLGRRIKAVGKLANFGPSWLKRAANLLPGLALGGAITPLATSRGGVQSLAEFKISTPDVLGLVSSKLKDRFAGLSISFDADVTFRMKDSSLSTDSYSPYDQERTIQVEVGFTRNGGQASVDLSRTTERRTIYVEVDGVKRAIAVEKVSTKVSGESNLLESVGIELGVDGRIAPDEFYVYDALTRRPIENLVMRSESDDRIFVGGVLGDPAIRAAVIELLEREGALPGGQPGGTDLTIDDILVAAVSKAPPPPEVLRGTGENAGAKYDVERGIVEVPGSEPGVAREIIVGGNPTRRNTAAGVIKIMDDGSQVADLIVPNADGELERFTKSVSGEILRDGQLVSEVEARGVNLYLDRLTKDNRKSSPYLPSLELDEIGNIKITDPSNNRARNILVQGDKIRTTEEGRSYEVSSDGENTEIRIKGNPLPFDFSDVGGIVGRQLGYRLAGGNALAGVVSSAALKTIGDALGNVIDGAVSGGPIGSAVERAFSKFGDELFGNLQSAAAGALSSFLTAQLIGAIGLDGFAGELANSAGGAVIGQIVSNIAGVNGTVGSTNPFNGVNPALIGTAVGSFRPTWIVPVRSTARRRRTVAGQSGFTRRGSARGQRGASSRSIVAQDKKALLRRASGWPC